MLFVFYVYAAANKPYAQKETFELKVAAGVLTKVAVLIPSGHQALAHLVIRDGNTPFVPEKGGIGVVGDSCIVHWEGWKEIKDTPHKLYADVWNEDDTHLHGFYIYMTILPRHIAYPFGKVVELLSKLLERFRVFRL